jgi:hypothetical protein
MKLIADGAVSREGAVLDQPKAKVAEGDVICIDLPEPETLETVAQDIPLDVVYEDEHLIVVDKPAGMVVHPAPGTPDGTGPIAFRFRPARHEPGPRTIMGRTYPPGTGESQAAQAFTTFAHAPQTATHIATKMARHFAGDTPPPALVERLSRAFTQGRGDLPVLYAALLDSPEVWAPVPLKFKTPWDWLVSALRGLDTDALPAERIAGMLEKLGQPVRLSYLCAEA